jgi:hypothetical protein
MTPGVGYSPKLHRKTLDVSTDAAGDGHIGICSVRDTSLCVSVKYEGPLFQKLGLDVHSPVHLLELFGIISAAILCPRNCNLRVFTDNTSCIFAVSKGGSRETRFGNAIQKLRNILSRKAIVLVLEWVASADNPADYSSRTLVKDPIVLPNCNSLSGYKHLFCNSFKALSRESLLQFENQKFELKCSANTLPLWR